MARFAVITLVTLLSGGAAASTGGSFSRGGGSFDASAAVAGFPITSMLRGMPFLGISSSAVPGNAPPEVLIRLSHVVYRPWL